MQVHRRIPFLILLCFVLCCAFAVLHKAEIVLWHILHQLLCGLLVLHNKKYSHHDIKPENIFLFQQISYEDFVNINQTPEHYRGKIHLKLGDFGQTQRDSCETRHEAGDAPADIMGGTRMYRPPEMIEGKAGSYPSDLFSVGVVMCVVTALLSGHISMLLTSCSQVQACNGLTPFPAGSRGIGDSNVSRKIQPCRKRSEELREKSRWQIPRHSEEIPRLVA